MDRGGSVMALLPPVEEADALCDDSKGAALPRRAGAAGAARASGGREEAAGGGGGVPRPAGVWKASAGVGGAVGPDDPWSVTALGDAMDAEPLQPRSADEGLPRLSAQRPGELLPPPALEGLRAPAAGPDGTLPPPSPPRGSRTASAQWEDRAGGLQEQGRQVRAKEMALIGFEAVGNRVW
jgi:hypothetical protein